MNKLTKYLNQLISGMVFDTPESLAKYSTDQSILQIMPKYVVLPEDTNDVKHLLAFVNRFAAKGYAIPVAVRGSGQDKTGADLTPGIVISTEKLNRIQEIDTRERLIRVQAGITVKELNAALAVNGLTLPIKVDGSETIGGLISNYSTDSFAAKFGGIMKYVERLEVVLANGECIQTKSINAHSIARLASQKTLESTIYSKLYNFSQKNADLVDRIRSNNTSLAGYQGFAYATKKTGLDLTPVFFGAQGTLGVITEAIIRCEPIIDHQTRFMLTFSSFRDATNFLDYAQNYQPIETNIYDARILNFAAACGKDIIKVPKQHNLVAILNFDKSKKKAQRILKKCQDFMPSTATILAEDDTNRIKFDTLERAAELFRANARGLRPSIMTDFYVPNQRLHGFANDLKDLEKESGIDLWLYGSYATNNYHLYPTFDMATDEGCKKAIKYLKDISAIIENNDGSIAGGRPEGRLKAIFTNRSLDDFEKPLYLSIKKTFDPNNILNPDTKLGANTKFTLNHLRNY